MSFVLSKRHGALRRKTEFAHTRDVKSMGLHLDEAEGPFLHVVSSTRESGTSGQKTSGNTGNLWREVDTKVQCPGHSGHKTCKEYSEVIIR